MKTRVRHAGRLAFTDALAAAPRGRAVVLAVPGEAVTSLEVAVPARLGARAQTQILRGAVEARLAADPARTFVLPLPPAARHAGTRAALAVDRGVLRGWFDAAAGAGLRVSAIVPDYLCLPGTPAGWTLAVRDDAPDRLIVRLSGPAGFADAVGPAIAMLEHRMRGKGGSPEAIAIFDATGNAALRRFADGCAERGIAVARHDTPPPVEPPRGVSLLAGVGGGDTALGPRMRAAAVPVAACLLALAAWSADTWLEIRAAEARLAAERDRTEALFARIVGPEVPMIDARAQVQAAVSALHDAASADGAEARFPALLARVAPTLAEHPGRIDSLRFGAEGLTVALETDSFARLDTLRDSLADRAVALEVDRSARSDDDRVSATLVLSVAPEAGR